MDNDHSNLSHHPDHLVDLRKSGLSDDMINQAGIYSVPPRDINMKLGPGFPHPEKVTSLMAFPYPGADGFERFKLFPSLEGRKYHQQKGTGNHLYIPIAVTSIIKDASIPVYITEGEKKSLKACQEGLPCVAIGGLWSWSDGTEEKNLIPDSDQITLEGRTVNIVPDNDWLSPDHHGERKHLRQAVYELGYRLIDRGAKVFVIELPEGPEKIGLDDYLCQHSVQEFRALSKREIRKQSIEEMIQAASLETLRDILKRLAGLPETERAIHINSLAKKLNITRRAIQRDLKKSEPQQADDTKILTTAYFPNLVDLCLDKDGKVVFLINREGILEAVTVCEIDGSPHRPPERSRIPFLLPSTEAVLTWASKNDDILFEDILSHLQKFSYLPEHQFIAVALFIFLTYVQDHPDIQYFPMLLFWSAPERGKSRSGKAVAYCSFRGIHIVDMREANLFRYSQNFHATLFIDMMDLWKKAERNQSEDVLLLRFERGAVVGRVLYPEKGAFKDMVYFDVYGPTVMASNEPVHHILDTRCLPISMQNRPRNYENPTPEKLRDIRERLTAWRAKVMGHHLPEVEVVPNIDGRLWDISKPLFQVCKMVCPSNEGMLRSAILEMAGQRVEEKQESMEGQIIGILKDLSPDGLLSEWSISLDDIQTRMNEKRPEGHKLTSRYIGQKIKSIGLKKRRTNAGYQVEVVQSAFDILLSQFGFANISDSTPPETFTTLTDAHRSTDSEGYGVNVGVNVQGDIHNVHQTFTEEKADISKGCEHSELGEHSPENTDNKINNLFEVMDDGQFTY
jgi:hypothetical protein